MNGLKVALSTDTKSSMPGAVAIFRANGRGPDAIRSYVRGVAPIFNQLLYF